jgi:GT2 family glycosyltransferase
MINLVKNFSKPEVIWQENGELVPLKSVAAGERTADVAAIIVNRDRPDLVEELIGELKEMGSNLQIDIFVVEMGSSPETLYDNYTYYYRDDEFRGKCFGHNVGLRIARYTGNYRYYWILMNDIRFDRGTDAVQELVDIADKNPNVAILSPTERDSDYPSSRPRNGKTFHVVSTCDYLGFLIRSEAIEKAGFLNPVFKYSWGAIHELSYHLYSNGYSIAYCDSVKMKHLGGTTYGKTKNTISREKYQENAKLFCMNYFRKKYGENWDEVFSRVLPRGIEHNTYRIHKMLWEKETMPRRLEKVMNRIRYSLTGLLKS